MALGNFVFPLILNIIQIIFITSDRSFLHGTYVMVINDYVSIFGVVFATIWTNSAHYNQTTMGSTGSSWNQSGTEKTSATSASRRNLPIHTLELSNRSAEYGSGSGTKLHPDPKAVSTFISISKEYETHTDRSSVV